MPWGSRSAAPRFSLEAVNPPPVAGFSDDQVEMLRSEVLGVKEAVTFYTYPT